MPKTATTLHPAIDARPAKMSSAAVEAQRLLTELQDEVLDDTHEWLDTLPVDDQLRWEIFEQFAIVTGKMLNRLLPD